MTITTGKHTVLHIYIYIDQSSAVRFYEKAYLQSRKKKKKKKFVHNSEIKTYFSPLRLESKLI